MTTATATAEGSDRRGTFQPGQSGNPTGRPPGSRNRSKLALEILLDGEAENLTRKAIELAKAGDMTALRLCMERIYPARKDTPVTFDMPKLETPADAIKAMAAIMATVAGGDLTPAEANELAKLVDHAGHRGARIRRAAKAAGGRHQMSRGLDTRLSKLEAKRDLADDDLSRLTAEELDARIAVLRLLVEAQRTGQLAETRARLEADPATAPVLAAMDRRPPSRASCERYAGMTEAQLDERIAQLTASFEAA